MRFVLSNGISIPSPGYGTYNLGEVSEIHNKIVTAAECGFRHFDTATAYGNEEEIGKGLSFVFKNVCSRSEIFITGKLSNDDLRELSDGYYAAKQAFERTLNKLQLEYLDLYLIHWPVPRDCEHCWKELNISTWAAMEELYKEGLIKAIGLSNFEERHIQNIVKDAQVMPMVNQIEIHPMYQQRDLIKYCIENNICVESWGPLKQGEVFKIPELQRISDKYSKSISQLCLKFCEQLNALPIVKCSSKERMSENLCGNDWIISAEDMEALFLLDSNTGRYNNYAYQRRDNC